MRAAVDDGAAARVARLEERRFCGDRHLLRQAANAHLDVDGGRFVDLEHHPRARVLLESRELDAHRVGARAEERNRVAALGVRHGRGRFVGGDVCQRDGGARQGALARIEDLASNGCAELLGGGATGRGQQQCGP